MTTKPHSINDFKINPTILGQNGYKEYRDGFQNKESYISSWQKCVQNEHGKAYFINFNFHDNSYFFNLNRGNVITANPYSWSLDLQFKDMEEEMVVNVKVFSSNKDLHTIEKFCERLFKKMEFQNDEYWEVDGQEKHQLEQKEQRILEAKVELEGQLPSKKESPKRRKI